MFYNYNLLSYVEESFVLENNLIIQHDHDGLDTDFEALVIVITSQMAMMTIPTMRSLLLIHEVCNTSVHELYKTVPSVNVVQ